jgi:hypothetical protein
VPKRILVGSVACSRFRAAAAIGEPPTGPGRAEVAGEVRFGIDIVGADHRHRSQRATTASR